MLHLPSSCVHIVYAMLAPCCSSRRNSVPDMHFTLSGAIHLLFVCIIPAKRIDAGVWIYGVDQIYRTSMFATALGQGDTDQSQRPQPPIRVAQKTPLVLASPK